MIKMTNVITMATKEFTWDCAHLLDGHMGLCKNLHGHTYKMQVTLARRAWGVISGGPADGMVLDFKHIKDMVKSLIVDPLDHACIVNTESHDEFEQDLHQLLLQHGKKLYLFTGRATAENMAKYFIEVINNELFKRDYDVLAIQLRLYETPTSFADVYADFED